MMLAEDVLKAAVVGLLVEEGHDAEGVWVALDKFGVGPHAPNYIQHAIRKVASVALTFQAHGVMRETTN